jgi:hypothetical protein
LYNGKEKKTLLELYAETFSDPAHKILARKFAVSLYRDDMGGNRGIHKIENDEREVSPSL